MGIVVSYSAQFPARGTEKTRELRVLSDGNLEYWDLINNKMLWKSLWSIGWTHFVPYEIDWNGFHVLCYQKYLGGFYLARLTDSGYEKIVQEVWRIGWETFEVEYDDENRITMLLSKRNGEISHDTLTFNGWERGYSIDLPSDEQVAKFLDEEGAKMLHNDSDEDENDDADPTTEEDCLNSPRHEIRSGSSGAEEEEEDDESGSSLEQNDLPSSDTSLKHDRDSELTADLSPPALCRNLTL